MIYILIFSTVSSKQEAQKLAKLILKNKLAACINVIPNIESHYLWKGKITQSKEVMLVIKTRKSLYKKVEKFLIKSHSYDLPEIIAIPIEAASKAYLSWINSETSQVPPSPLSPYLHK